MSADPDAVVVGTGPAGLVHAVLLAGTGRRVCAVGPSRAPRPGTFELLGARAAGQLRDLGLGGVLQRIGRPSGGTVFRWVDRSFRERGAEPDDEGWIVDRAVLDPLLREWAARRGVTVRTGTVGRVMRTDGGCRLELVDGAGVRSGLTTPSLVLATGRGGRLPARFGLPRRDGPPTVAITTAQPQPFPRLGPRLLVDAARDGWWYALGDGRCATIGFVTDADRVPSPAGMAAAWRRAGRDVEWLPATARDAPVRGRRSVLHAGAAGDDTVRAVGDAALAPDPLSGHGLTLALGGAARAATDPAEYAGWVAEQDVAHRDAGEALYRAAAMDGPFWRRRRAGSVLRT